MLFSIPLSVVAAAPPSECLRTSSGVCFSPDQPTSTQRIYVIIVVDNADDYCLRDLTQSVIGQVIRYEAVYDDCGDKALRKSSPLVYELSLGPLAPASYQVEFDAPSAPDVPPPPHGPLSFRTSLDVSPASSAPTAIPTAIEFYRVAADHYFVTAIADEINKLDSGYFQGWARTGQAMSVYAPSTTPSSSISPVCRFYGKPESGLDSHFYSAFPAECQAVIDRFSNAWVYESANVFMVSLPDATSGNCPAGTISVYRVYNNRPDVNHRYTTSLTIRAQMVAAGWIPEGYGGNAVAMCAPTP